MLRRQRHRPRCLDCRVIRLTRRSAAVPAGLAGALLSDPQEDFVTTEQTLLALIAVVGLLAAIMAGAVAYIRPQFGPALMVAATIGIGVVMFLRPA